MSNTKTVQAVDSDNRKIPGINTGTHLDDVELTKTLLENANQNAGKFSNADIVFSLEIFKK